MRFLYPQFLGLLGLALIPLIIHLFTRLRLRRHSFPSLVLLQTVRRERFSWVRLKEILLLITRTLFLLLIPLALSRPWLQYKFPFPIRAEQVLLILDDSYSMGYGHRWEEALNTARQIIQNCRNPLLVLTSKPESVYQNQKAIIRMLDTLRTSASARTLNPALNTAESVCGPTPMPVFIITDLQQRALPESDLPSILKEVQIINLGRETFENAGITEVQFHNNRLKVQLFNFGNSPVTRTTTLKLKDYTEEQTITIPPRSPAAIEFPITFDQPGVYTGRVELSLDSLLIDNIRYFALDISGRITVPIFVSDENPGEYIRLALITDTLHFQPLVLNLAELRRTDLNRYPVIIIGDATPLKTADFDRLDFYLNSGGAMLLCLPSVPQSGIERLVLAQEPLITSGFVTPAEIDTGHPVLSGFQTEEFKSMRIFRHTRVTGGRALIRLSDQNPMMMELPGKNLMVWSFAPDPKYTDLIYKAVFVPLLHQTLNYLAAKNFRNRWFVGDTALLTVPTTEPVRIVSPAYEKTLTPALILSRPVVKITDTRVPGIYRLEGRTPYAFAVNPLPEEGDLTPIPVRQLSPRGIKIVQSQPASLGELTGLFLYLAAFIMIGELLMIGLENYKKIPVRR